MKPHGALSRYVLLPVIAAVVLSLGRSAAAAETEMRGIWMHATQIKTRAEADQWVAKIDLAPSSGRTIDIEKEKLRGEKWAEFRAWGVTELVRDVYRRAKKIKPRAQVTAAVFTPLASAKRACQDWPGWLREGIIDYVIPMAYTPSNERLTSQLQEWKTLDPTLERIIPGLSIYKRTAEGTVTRDIALILSQHKLCMDSGARGNVYFALPYLSDPLVEALSAGPNHGKLRAYRPPPRKE